MSWKDTVRGVWGAGAGWWRWILADYVKSCGRSPICPTLKSSPGPPPQNGHTHCPPCATAIGVLRTICHGSMWLPSLTTAGGGLNQRKFILSQFWRPQVQNQSKGPGHAPYKTPLGEDHALFLEAQAFRSCDSITPMPAPTLVWPSPPLSLCLFFQKRARS